MKPIFGVLLSLLLGLHLAACSPSLPTTPRGAESATLVRVAASATHAVSSARVFASAGDITTNVTAFRDALGNLNANAPGSRLSGRREINWDAVPPAFTNTNDFPSDFFNQPVVGRARGLVSTTRGTGFRVSDDNFADVKPDFDGPFVFFSPIRTFAPVGSSRMTATLFVPGTDTAATSTGFGVVFSDVDRFGSASIELLDAGGRSLGRYAAPPAPGGVSFVGVVFPTAIVRSVEIRSGRGVVVGDRTDPRGLAASPASASRRGHDDGGDRGGPDLVIMDDFIYGEPIPVRAETGRAGGPIQ